MAVTAEEKIRQLIAEEAAKRKEIADAKADLEKKKKEAEDLEKKRTGEISAARRELQSKIEEMVLEERKAFEEQEEAGRKRDGAPTQEQPLEEKVGGGQAPRPAMRGYGQAVEEVMRGNPTFYDVTNYNVMNRLESIAKDAASRPLSSEESAFVNAIHSHASSMMQDGVYRDRQSSSYLARELTQIDKITRLSEERERQMKERTYNV